MEQSTCRRYCLTQPTQVYMEWTSAVKRLFFRCFCCAILYLLVSRLNTRSFKTNLQFVLGYVIGI